jgi:hypothetical protein
MRRGHGMRGFETDGNRGISIVQQGAADSIEHVDQVHGIER